jgi:hypothetical protein
MICELLVAMTPCRLLLVVCLKKLRIYCEDVVVLHAFIVVSACVLTLSDVLL